MATANSVNWKKIRAEYISDPSTSYRKLAKKYKVSQTCVCAMGKKERWPELREQRLTKTYAEAVDAIAEAEKAAFTQLQTTANYLLQRLDRCAQQKSDEELDAWFRDYSLTLKSLKDVLQTPMENRKKLAEIEAIRKGMETETQEDIHVIIDGEAAKYIN